MHAVLVDKQCAHKTQEIGRNLGETFTTINTFNTVNTNTTPHNILPQYLTPTHQQIIYYVYSDP